MFGWLSDLVCAAVLRGVAQAGEKMRDLRVQEVQEAEARLTRLVAALPAPVEANGEAKGRERVKRS